MKSENLPPLLNVAPTPREEPDTDIVVAAAGAVFDALFCNFVEDIHKLAVQFVRNDGEATAMLLGFVIPRIIRHLAALGSARMVLDDGLPMSIMVDADHRLRMAVEGGIWEGVALARETLVEEVEAGKRPKGDVAAFDALVARFRAARK